jgi:hypothetical protein
MVPRIPEIDLMSAMLNKNNTNGTPAKVERFGGKGGFRGRRVGNIA